MFFRSGILSNNGRRVLYISNMTLKQKLIKDFLEKFYEDVHYMTKDRSGIVPVGVRFKSISPIEAEEWLSEAFRAISHQLKEQVLEAVGKDKEIFYPNDGGTYFQITPYINEEKAEIRKRIEAVFDDEVVKL